MLGKPGGGGACRFGGACWLFWFLLGKSAKFGLVYGSGCGRPAIGWNWNLDSNPPPLGGERIAGG